MDGGERRGKERRGSTKKRSDQGNWEKSVWRRKTRRWRRRMEESAVLKKWALWSGGEETNPSIQPGQRVKDEGEEERRRVQQCVCLAACAAAEGVCLNADCLSVHTTCACARLRGVWPCSAGADCPAVWRCRGIGRRWTVALLCARARAPPACWLSSSGGRTDRTCTGYLGDDPGSEPAAPVALETTSGRYGSDAQRCYSLAGLPW